MRERVRTNGEGWRRVIRVAVLLALGLAAAGELRADLWYVHYENAEHALKKGQWRTAVSELRQAIKRKGDSGARVRSYGMKVVDYFPYLKLGIAYHHLGEESAALEAFDTEERLGVVQSSRTARGELAKYRQLAVQAQQQTASTANRRTEEIVQNSLAEARRLDGQGHLREAMNALAPGLAVDPKNRESVDLMASLGSRAVAQELRERAQGPARTWRGATSRRLSPPPTACSLSTGRTSRRWGSSARPTRRSASGYSECRARALRLPPASRPRSASPTCGRTSAASGPRSWSTPSFSSMAW
jgi:tetratricopeptide (TPR) repeat protein